ncbi:hypothetical protein PM082_017200 [Marasmius tenuissimus]|nr:hypothetical protein PM082_017200 [Marasmius tenuissimus]
MSEYEDPLQRTESVSTVISLGDSIVERQREESFSGPWTSPKLPSPDSELHLHFNTGISSTYVQDSGVAGTVSATYTDSATYVQNSLTSNTSNIHSASYIQNNSATENLDTRLILKEINMLRLTSEAILNRLRPDLLAPAEARGDSKAPNPFATQGMTGLPELDQKDYSAVNYWHVGQWKGPPVSKAADAGEELAKEAGSKKKKKKKAAENQDQDSTVDTKKQEREYAALKFIEDQNGIPVPGARLGMVTRDARAFFRAKVLAGKITSGGWDQVELPVRIEYYQDMRLLIPELQLCFGNWKADRVAKEIFSGWWQSHRKAMAKEEEAPSSSALPKLVKTRISTAPNSTTPISTVSTIAVTVAQVPSTPTPASDPIQTSIPLPPTPVSTPVSPVPVLPISIPTQTMSTPIQTMSTTIQTTTIQTTPIQTTPTPTTPMTPTPTTPTTTTRIIHAPPILISPVSVPLIPVSFPIQMTPTPVQTTPIQSNPITTPVPPTTLIPSTPIPSVPILSVPSETPDDSADVAMADSLLANTSSATPSPPTPAQATTSSKRPRSESLIGVSEDDPMLSEGAGTDSGGGQDAAPPSKKARSSGPKIPRIKLKVNLYPECEEDNNTQQDHDMDENPEGADLSNHEDPSSGPSGATAEKLKRPVPSRYNPQKFLQFGIEGTAQNLAKRYYSQKVRPELPANEIPQGDYFTWYLKTMEEDLWVGFHRAAKANGK